MRQEIGLGANQFGQKSGIQTHKSDISKFLKDNSVNQMSDSNRSISMVPNIQTSGRLSLYHNDRATSLQVRRIQARRPVNLPKNKATVGARGADSKRSKVANANQQGTNKESFLQTLADLWRGSRIVIMLWLCRALAFLQVYGYHDWQSLPYLIWIVHSTLYKSSKVFSICMMTVYLPCFTATYIWYYLININGIIDWGSRDYKTNYYYNLGFYEFNVPILETGFLFLCLFCMIDFCKLLRLATGVETQSEFAIQKM